MRRATLLVVCLSLAFLSLSPLTAPVAAQQALPAAFVGHWEGLLVQINPDTRYPVSIELTGGSPGSAVGTIDYPTLGCSGNLVLQSVAGSQATLTERLTVGQTICTYVDATVTLTQQADGSLAFGWSHPTWAGSLTGTLMRPGEAPTPEPTPVSTSIPTPTPIPPTATSEPVPADVAVAQPDAAAFAAALAARADAPSLAGPVSGTLIRSASAFPAAAGAGVTAETFVATVTVVTPSESTAVPWDFGLSFGRTPDSSQQLVIFSNGSWSYWTAPEGNMRSGWVTLNLAPGGVNTLDLVVEDTAALFGINGQFVARIELLRTVAADVEVITGFPFRPLPTEEGRELTYTDFQVWATATLTEQTTGVDEPSGDQPSGQPEATTEAPSGAVFVVPDPAECVITPRTAESFPALATEPDAAMRALSAAIETPGLDIPEGALADAMTTAAVVDTYRQFTACSSAGNEWASFALWTDDALRQLTIEPTSGASVPAGQPLAFRVSDVRMLPDGRVVAVYELRGPDEGTYDQGAFVQALVWQDDRFLIDETLDLMLPAASSAALVPQPEVSTALPESLPESFVGHWEGTATWNEATMPVALDLTGGGVGEVVGTVEYALYGSAGPRCGGEVSLENIAADGREIVLEGTITEDPTVCLVDATVSISLQDTGAVGYLWNHPALTVSGTGTLIHTTAKN
jgi:hypothetical protein